MSGEWLDVYSPFRLVRAPNPLFEREMRLAGLHYSLQYETHIDFEEIMAFSGLAILIFAFLVIGVASVLFTTIGLWLPVLFVTTQIVISLGVDVYGIARTTAHWAIHARADKLDLLRLTDLSETDIVSAFAAINQLRLWKALRLETLLRMLIPAILWIPLGFAMVMTVFAPVLILTSLFSDRTALVVLGAFEAVAIMAFALLILYLVEPLWRMRAIVALSLFMAARLRDNNIAIFLAVAVAFGWRLLLVAGATWLAINTVWILMLSPPGVDNLGSLWTLSALSILTCALIPVLRVVYGIMQRRLLDLTARYVRQGV